MIHERERLSLSRESSDHLLRIQARLDDFKGDGAPYRLILLRHEDDAHAAFADLLEEFIGADNCPGAFG